MPLYFGYKEKESKFEGLPSSFSVNVSGPAEIFPKDLRKFLFFHGLNAWKDDREFVYWNTAGSTGARPMYLARLLQEQFGVAPNRDAADFLKRATGARRANAYNAITGVTAADIRGNDALSVVVKGETFIANCNEDDPDRREFLEGAGWLPVKNPSQSLVSAFGSQPYATRDSFMAENLSPFMNETARNVAAKMQARSWKFIESSQTHDVPDDFAVPVPDGLDYLNFQKGGIQQVLDVNKGAILADDMGLGKTIQGIGILNGRAEAKRVLVICQANMRLKWVREIEKWKTNPDLTIGHAEGNFFPDTDVVVINYDIAQRHEARLRAQEWDLVLADEAHNMKNHEAQRTQAILGTLLGSREDADFRDMLPISTNGLLVHLTGTPKPNRISELWPLLSSSRPDIWGRGPEARQVFMNRYEPPALIKKKMKKGSREYQVVIPLPGKPQRELELQMRMRGSGSFIRRLKRDTELPPKFRTPIPMPYKLSAADIKMLRSAETELEQLLERAGAFRNVKIRPGESKVATALIDVIDGPGMKGIDFNELARFRANIGRLKAPLAGQFIIDELLADNDLPIGEQRKTVAFAHHKEVIQTIAGMAREHFPKGVLVYDGKVTSSKKRQEIIDSFQEDPNARLLIISLSGATGITATASARMRVVEPDYSPSNMSQIEDRIWRIGQEQNVDIGYLFIPGSTDENVGMSLISKMETDERAINKLSFRGMGSKAKTKKTDEKHRVKNVDDFMGKTDAASQQTAQSEFDFARPAL